MPAVNPMHSRNAAKRIILNLLSCFPTVWEAMYIVYTRFGQSVIYLYIRDVTIQQHGSVFRISSVKALILFHTINLYTFTVRAEVCHINTKV